MPKIKPTGQNITMFNQHGFACDLDVLFGIVSTSVTTFGWFCSASWWPIQYKNSQIVGTVFLVDGPWLHKAHPHRTIMLNHQSSNSHSRCQIGLIDCETKLHHDREKGCAACEEKARWGPSKHAASLTVKNDTLTVKKMYRKILIRVRFIQFTVNEGETSRGIKNCGFGQFFITYTEGFCQQ